MSVEMGFAECQHHSAQRPKKAKARQKEREVHYTAAFRTTVPPPEPELFDLFEERGGEAARLAVGAAGHNAEHIIDVLPYVHILVVPVPQMGNQVVEVLQKIDRASLADPEQVIAVPKISF